MTELSCRLPVLVFRVGRPLGAALACVAAAIVLSSTGNARAQVITTQMLIGDAVDTTSIARYTDVDEAIKRFINRDVLAARQFLESAKKKDPALPPVDMLLAKMFFLSGNATAGRSSLEKTASENADDPEAVLILADQNLQQRRTIEAEALYEKGLALNSKFNGASKRKRNFEIRARAGRASVAQQRHNWEAAANDLRALIKIDPENGRAHFALGQSLFMLKQFQEGYTEFGLAKEKDKTLADPDVATALMYDQLKVEDKAAQSQKFFERALAHSKTDDKTVTAYASWLIKSGNPQSIAKAEAMLADARKANPEANPGKLNLLILSGVAARMSKKMKPAEDFFVEALGIAPANPDAINQLALLLIEQPGPAQRERALQFAGISARLNDQSADAQITLAWVLYQLGRVVDADGPYRQGLQLGNLSQDSSYLVARILVDQNKIDTAKQILKSALDAETAGIFVYRQEAQTLLNSLNK